MPSCIDCGNTDTFVEPLLTWDKNSYSNTDEVQYSKNLWVEESPDSYKSYCFECESHNIDWDYRGGINA